MIALPWTLPMCGRYKLSTPGDELWESFDLHGEQLPLVPRFNIAPTQPIAVIREPHKLELIRWGLTLPNPRAGGFNVRVESLKRALLPRLDPRSPLPDLGRRLYE